MDPDPTSTLPTPGEAFAPTLLGPFLVTGPLGRGATGSVWRGRHQGDGTPVALKVLEPQTIPSPEQFRREVRAIAALDHPGIVAVYDHGVVDRQAAERSGGRLPEGARWLATELVEGQPLSELRCWLPWASLQPVLIGLLDAFAHAHSRGVLHGDLKPDKERIARHHIDAGDLREALRPLRQAAAVRTDGAGVQDSWQLLDEHDALLDQLGAAPDDPDRVEGARLRSSFG